MKLKFFLPLPMVLLVSVAVDARPPVHRGSLVSVGGAELSRERRRERTRKSDKKHRRGKESGRVRNLRTYLNTESYSSEIQSKLLAAADGDVNLSAEETWDLMRLYEESAEFKQISEHYTEDLFTTVKANPANPEAWRRENPRLALGIRNYVGDSGEGEMDEAVSWQSINRKLRNLEDFNEEEQTFYNAIADMVNALPQVKGLVFRGQAMTRERFDAVPVKAGWHQAAFTSTSLSPTTARAFGTGGGSRQTAILILRVKNGAPVSPLTFDTGQRGQPGRMGEQEVLLADGETLFVNAKIEDKANNLYYIFAEQE